MSSLSMIEKCQQLIEVLFKKTVDKSLKWAFDVFEDVPNVIVAL